MSFTLLTFKDASRDPFDPCDPLEPCDSLDSRDALDPLHVQHFKYRIHAQNISALARSEI